MNINIKQVYRHTHLTKTFWDHEFLMDFVLENGFYLWSKSVENFGQPGCFSDPLPSSRTRTTPQNDSQGLPTGGITPNKDLLLLGRSFPFRKFREVVDVHFGLNFEFVFPSISTCQSVCMWMHVWCLNGPTGAGFDFAFARPVSFFFLTKTPFKSWFALFRRVILSATKNGAPHCSFSYMLFPNQGMLCLACTKSWRLLRSWWVDRSERWREEIWWTNIWWFQVLVFDTFGRHHFTNIYMFKNMGIFG